MRLISLLFALLFLWGCQSNIKKEMSQNMAYPFYVGTYTDGDSEGIYKYLLQKDGKLEQIGLKAKTENPSFLGMSSDGKFLVTVNETNKDGSGTVESYIIEDDSLTFISRSPSGGAHPCFVAINENGFVIAANYSSGSVGLLHLNEMGELSGLLDVQQHTGKGTTDRQQAPHAHSAWFVGKNEIIAADLGTNELWFSRLDALQKKLLPSKPQKLAMKPGAGPRHLCFHPKENWIYVVNELDCTVTLVKKTEDVQYEKGESASTLPSGFSEASFCADIHISPDGKFVYASNRGHNSIAVFDVNNKDGSLELIVHQDVMGEWPRNFALSPDGKYLLVANQYSNNIVSFKRDRNTGLLEYIYEIEVPNPVCILF
jgi:6-phosphogluconolactonase